MQRRQFRCGIGGDDGVAADDLTFLPAPAFPQCGKRHGRAIGHGDSEGLLGRFRPFAQALPFIEAIRKGNGAALHKSVAEGWFFGDGFRPRIHHAAANGRIIRPARDQPPAQGIQMPGTSFGVAPQYQPILCRCAVEGRHQIGQRIHRAGIARDLATGAVLEIAPAHGG